MNQRLLIDAIVRQTTVLVAQLSTNAGVRSPLARVADQVFLSLAHEIERQGVGRKVVADMFGLALRSYQRKVTRLSESHTASGKTLWETMLAYIAEGPVRRDRLLERFRHDDELAVTAVLSDLVASGLCYASGRGDAAVYGVTSDADRRALSGDEPIEALAIVLWGMVFRVQGTTTTELLGSIGGDTTLARAALDRLLADGRVSRDGPDDAAKLRASSFIIPEGAPQGWEAAVFDHFQAMATGIAEKLRRRTHGEANDGTVGGTTLHFGIHAGHPYESQVLGLLSRIRAELNDFWREVAAYNRAHPASDEITDRVTFYFGQMVRRSNVA